MEKTLSEIVRTTEQNFINGNGTQMSKYVNTDLYEDINKIYAYLNSKHISGETDSQGREKPFFNIVIAGRNITYRATDIDRKDITIKPTKIRDDVPAFLATIHLQNWMRKENFGSFLNDWGLDLAAFNSSVVKFVEAEGELHCMVVPWSRLIVDQINFDKNLKIEILELTEAELKQRKGYDQKMVERLCDALDVRRLMDKTMQDNKDDYVKLYEVHGVMPLSFLTGKEDDEDTYVQQMHVLSFVESKNKGQFDDFTLVSGRETRDPYMLTALLPATDGSISLDGSVKNLFESQWMMNHTAKNIKDQLDIASKLIFQTADGNFVGRNVLSSIEQGDILVHAVNMPLEQINNTSHDITSQQSFANMWKGLSNEINGVSESMLGQVAPSGTAWRQVEALLNESHSLFDLMTENKGLYIEDMLRKFVIPFLKKQMDHADEISATLEGHGISKIDAKYVPQEAVKRFNEDAVNKVLKYLDTQSQSDIPSPYQQQTAEAQIKKEMASLGNQRFFVPSDIPDVTWKEVFKDLEWEVEVDVTGESSNKQTILTTLNTALATVANPMYASNPTAQFIVGKILENTGVVSPIELGTMEAQVQAQPQPVAQPLPNSQPVNAG